MSFQLTISERLRSSWSQDPKGEEWFEQLPALVCDLGERWNLRFEQQLESDLSILIAAGDVVLKLNAPTHFDAHKEADALAHWAGGGAVRLFKRDDARHALLIERCRPGCRLSASDVDEPAVVATLLPRLWAEPDESHQFKRLADAAARWASQVSERYRRASPRFEQRLLDCALDVFRTADATAGWLVNQDLHGANVLRAEREPWLVIDPKPVVGEREANGVAALRNAARTGGEARVREWLDALSELGLDRERLRGWGVAHALAWGQSNGGWAPEHLDYARSILAA